MNRFFDLPLELQAKISGTCLDGLREDFKRMKRRNKRRKHKQSEVEDTFIAVHLVSARTLDDFCRYNLRGERAQEEDEVFELYGHPPLEFLAPV